MAAAACREGGLWRPCSLAEGRVGQVTEGEGRAQAEHTQVGAGICHGLGGDRQQLEQAGGQSGPCHSHQKGDDQGSGEKGPRGFLQAGGVLGAGLLGDADHAPCGQARAQGCDRKHTVEALLMAANPVSPTILPTTKRSTS